MQINTVTGKIKREELGVVSTHEHVLLDLTAFYRALPVKGIIDPSTEKVKIQNLGILYRDCYALKDNLILDDEKLQTKELSYFKKQGGFSHPPVLLFRISQGRYRAYPRCSRIPLLLCL